MGFPGGSVVKKKTCLPTQDRQEMRVWSLSQEDPLEEEMATHSSILAWKIPQIEEHGRVQSMGSQRVGHYWVRAHTPTHTRTHTHVLPLQMPLGYLWVLTVAFNFYVTYVGLVSIYLTKIQWGHRRIQWGPLYFLETSLLNLTSASDSLSIVAWDQLKSTPMPLGRFTSPPSPTLKNLKKLLSLKSLRKMGCWTILYSLFGSSKTLSVWKSFLLS